jgi:segregation and condensation protein A
MPDDEEYLIVEQVKIPLDGTGFEPKIEALPAKKPEPFPEPPQTVETTAPAIEEPARPDYSALLQEKDSGGIEILVEMAQKGELDPKNIDIIDATDRFLKAVAAAPRENLRQSGKIIFHACVLLRMKAEALLITRIEDLDAVTDDFIDFDTEGSPIIYDSNDEAVGRQITLADLQRALVRRSKRRQTRQRTVTLEQLIESLREAERLDEKRRERKEREPKAVIQMDGYQDMEDMGDILELAHDEDIEDVIARVEVMLAEKFEQMLRMSLPQLIKMLDGRGDWVDAFLAVLFLSNAGKLNLEQEIFYGPLYLVKNDPTALAPTGTEGAASAEVLAFPTPAEKEVNTSSSKAKKAAAAKPRKARKKKEEEAALTETLSDPEASAPPPVTDSETNFLQSSDPRVEFMEEAAQDVKVEALSEESTPNSNTQDLNSEEV